MALTVLALAQAIRVSDSAAETAQVTRLKNYAEAVVDRIASNAPEAVKDEAVIRLVGYAYDSPSAASGSGWANVVTNSGAGAILLPYREHRAAGVGGSQTAAVPGTPGTVTPGATGNPVTNIAVVSGDLQVTYQSGLVVTIDLPDPAVIDTGRLIPAGGADGTVLAKQSATDYDAAWEAPVADNRLIPAGGEDGTVLAKQSATDYDAAWEAPASVDVGNAIAVALNEISHDQPGLTIPANSRRTFTAHLDTTEGTFDIYRHIPILVHVSMHVTSNANARVYATLEYDSEDLFGGASFNTSDARKNFDFTGVVPFNSLGGLNRTSMELEVRTTTAAITLSGILFRVYGSIRNFTLPGSIGAGELEVKGVNLTKLADSVRDRLVPAGGAVNQILSKKSATDGDTEWKAASGGGGGGASGPEFTELLVHTYTQNDQQITITEATKLALISKHYASKNLYGIHISRNTPGSGLSDVIWLAPFQAVPSGNGNIKWQINRAYTNVKNYRFTFELRYTGGALTSVVITASASALRSGNFFFFEAGDKLTLTAFTKTAFT